MDIRLWLKPKKTAETKKRKIEDDDDDDVIPESPDVQIKSHKRKKSNDEHKSKSKKNEKPALKAVTVSSNLFGGPIKRTEPIVKKETMKTETGIHSDEEFEKSLLEIDDADDFKPKSHQADKKTKDNDKKSKNNGEKIKDNDKKLKSNERSKSPKPNHNDKNKEMDNKQKTEKIKVKSEKQDKSPFKLPSSSKESNSTKQKVVEIKKEIKESGKRKFSEFIEDHDERKNLEKKPNGDVKSENLDTNNDTINDSVLEDLNSSNVKKRKINKSLNESGLTDEERHERKMHSAALYQKYLNRTGPKHLGTKEMPEGAPNCFKDCAFLLTGVLDSFEREEIVETINKYGGCIKSGVSKKVTHVLAGDDAGPAKMAKAQELGIKILNEDDFLKMIKDSNSKKGSIHKTEKEIKREKKSKDSSHKTEVRARSKTKSKSPHKVKEVKIEKDRSPKKDVKDNKQKTEIKVENNNFKKEVREDKTREENKSKSSNVGKDIESKADVKINEVSSIANHVDTPTNAIMWVEKYKPQNVKQIIGQLGEASNVKKLTNWLTKWYVNRKAKLPKPSPWAKNDDGGFYKAALLSGPPGVGKTTTVSLVCKELGFDTVEFNASDTRNKTLIREQIGELLTSTSLSGYAKGETGKQAVSKKHVLVMDEVDGMAGNEDRGGLQELIGLIKSASVPIICMCNDRNSQKMRSLVNYCYDLRFSRPRVDQIKAAMRSICCKENIKIPPDALEQLIVSAGQDVRQTLNLLSMWAADPSLLDADRLCKDAQRPKKDVKLGPWDAIRKVFSAADHKTMSINNRSDLFFYDYSLAPLFVQENYLQVVPHCPKDETLDRISRAADSIAFGDLIDKRIRSNQAWSLLPMQAMYSSVLPGHYLSGHVGGQIQFPAWLGRNSRANKMHRLAQEIHAHTRLSTTGSKSSIFLDYSSHLRDAILNPLIKDKGDGVEQSLAVLQAYHLLREDLDSLTELSLWPGQRNPNVLIDSKVKAAMTRTYNKKASALPYAPPSVKRSRARADDDNEGGDDEDDGAEEEHDSDPENDALIKKKKTKESDSSSDKPSTSKGKGKGSSTSKGKSSSKKK